MKKIFIIYSICLFISISGFCLTKQGARKVQSLENTNDSILNKGVATINFKRQGSMMGAAVKHFLIDRGDSLNMNSVIFQNKTFAPEKFNFDVAGNVKRLYFKYNKMEAAVLVSKPTIKGLKSIDESKMDTSKLQLSILKYSKNFSVGSIDSESMVPNANLVAIVGSGETVVWKRPAGIMQLQVIAPNGDQAFAQSFHVEAGKSYTVTYYYMKAKFEISENK